RPTEYLRARCPACFGSNNRLSAGNSTVPDSIIQMDACFSQKHNLQTRDPPFQHPRNVMLSEEALALADERVEAMRSARGRPRKGSSRTRKRRAGSPDFDPLASGIQVPVEALRNCEDSFKAAQESIAKANTGQHDVTAAMALLC
ncbi:hypothetical protein BD626DRAFT_363531, partial [Schizophyllum amplum]